MEKKLFGKKMLFIIFPLIILFSKIIRYTIMRETLVDQARGDEILFDILYNSNLHFMVSGGFNNAALFFKAINIFNLTTYTQFEVFITIIWNIIVMIILINTKKINNKNLIFLSLTIGVLNIFAFTLAKEPIQMLYFAIIYWIFTKNINSKKKIVYSLLVVLLIAITYRSYYILMIGYTIITYIIFKHIINGKKEKNVFSKTLLIIIALVIFHILFLILSKNLFIDEYNEMIWVRTKNYSANTAIMTLISNSKNNIILFSLDYLLVIIRLLIPIELIKYGPQQWLFLAYQLIISSYIFNTIKNYKNNSKDQNIALYLYLGFIFASATFEPDFGSWIRHQAVAFPLLIVMNGLHKVKGGYI